MKSTLRRSVRVFEGALSKDYAGIAISHDNGSQKVPFSVKTTYRILLGQTSVKGLEMLTNNGGGPAPDRRELKPRTTQPAP